MTPTIDRNRARSRAEREAASRKRRTAVAAKEPPPMTLQERRQERAEREARHQAGYRSPVVLRTGPTLPQRIAALEAELEKLRGKKG